LYPYTIASLLGRLKKLENVPSIPESFRTLEMLELTALYTVTWDKHKTGYKYLLSNKIGKNKQTINSMLVYSLGYFVEE
jgi:hypothetical protein